MSDTRHEQSIAEAQQELIGDFALFDNWVDRYQYIIDMGRQPAAVPGGPRRPRRARSRAASRRSGC
jgi:cysteine desulfuration protein SufE